MMAFVYWTSDGGGSGVGDVPSLLVRWIRANGNPTLIVNGGDIYDRGKPTEFDDFLSQMDGDVSMICETSGNHDWKTRERSEATGEIPIGYERFWARFPPPLSRQPIDTTRKGGARYEHYVDLNGWRLIFLDTGPLEFGPWPLGDRSRVDWLRTALTSTPGRAKIVLAHHSRLSRGRHGDNDEVDELWRALFDAVTGAPLVAFTLAGHDHSVSLYGPRPKDNPASGSVAFERGIHVFVNGAGGGGHYTGWKGTKPDLHFDDDNYCVTRINLIDARTADVDVLNFGAVPRPTTQPTVLPNSAVRFRL